MDPASDREWACARLPRCPRAICELAKDGYVLGGSEERLDFKGFVDSDLVHGGKGIDDGLQTGWNGTLVSMLLSYVCNLEIGWTRTFCMSSCIEENLC